MRRDKAITNKLVNLIFVFLDFLIAFACIIENVIKSILAAALCSCACADFRQMVSPTPNKIIKCNQGDPPSVVIILYVSRFMHPLCCHDQG